MQRIFGQEWGFDFKIKGRKEPQKFKQAFSDFTPQPPPPKLILVFPHATDLWPRTEIWDTVDNLKPAQRTEGNF
jgi:hypothetical protein